MRSFEIFAASASASAAPDEAKRLYGYFSARLAACGIAVGNGIFGADMQVSLCNDGPVTLPFTVTSADLTRCNTTIIVSLLEDQLMNPRVTSITSASERSRDTIEL